jgi:hypothetical protein
MCGLCGAASAYFLCFMLPINGSHLRVRFAIHAE